MTEESTASPFRTVVGLTFPSGERFDGAAVHESRAARMCALLTLFTGSAPFTAFDHAPTEGVTGIRGAKARTGRRCTVCGRPIDSPSLEREVEGPGVVGRSCAS
jgi:hypothetical protein